MFLGIGIGAAFRILEVGELDEDDDEAALRAAMGKASANVASAAPDVEARVCDPR